MVDILLFFAAIILLLVVWEFVVNTLLCFAALVAMSVLLAFMGVLSLIELVVDFFCPGLSYYVPKR